MRVAVVYGAVTGPGRLRRALGEAIDRLPAGVEATFVDLGESPIAFADGRPPDELGGATASAVAAVAEAEAVLLATPVYRGSMTGALKNLLDHLPVAALERKPVAIVAMGASDHHYLGAERHLRDVLSFFGALTLPVAVYLTSADFGDGAPGERAAAALDATLAALLGAVGTVAWTDAGPRPLAASTRARN